MEFDNLNEDNAKRETVASMTTNFEAWREKADSEELPSDEEMAQNLSSEDLKRLQALGYVGGGVETKAE